MEESLCRDNDRAQPPLRELEVSTRWSNFSGLNFFIINLCNFMFFLFKKKKNCPFFCGIRLLCIKFEQKEK